jgi:hypothetical protein
MLNFTWNVFSQTGSVETYLIYKELEKERQERLNESNDKLAEMDSPIS